MIALEPIRVMHVLPQLAAGGMELALAAAIRCAPLESMRHSVVALRGEDRLGALLPEGTEVHCLRLSPNDPKGPWRLARLIRRTRPDVVHARNWGAWGDAAAARVLTFGQTPLVYSFHGLGELGQPMRRRVGGWALAGATSAIITVCESSRRWLSRSLWLPASRIGVIPNGVDTQRFAPGPPRPTGDRTIVGTVGNLTAVKNHALLLRACAELRRRGMPLELHIAGEGPMRASLEALAAELGLTDCLHLRGAVRDVPNFLRELDLFALPSQSEAHPNALLEAMATALPCVATGVGGVPEMLHGGRCGRVVAAEPEAMAAAIAELAASAQVRQRLGLCARQRACRQYALDRMARAYAELYTRLVRR